MKEQLKLRETFAITEDEIPDMTPYSFWLEEMCVDLQAENQRLKEELDILHYFFTWDLEWLKERKERGSKFTAENAGFKWTAEGNVVLYNKPKKDGEK